MSATWADQGSCLYTWRTRNPVVLAADGAALPDGDIRKEILLFAAADRFFIRQACTLLSDIWKSRDQRIYEYWREICVWLPKEPPAGHPATIFYAAQAKEHSGNRKAALELYLEASNEHPLAAACASRLGGKYGRLTGWQRYRGPHTRATIALQCFAIYMHAFLVRLEEEDVDDKDRRANLSSEELHTALLAARISVELGYMEAALILTQGDEAAKFCHPLLIEVLKKAAMQSVHAWSRLCALAEDIVERYHSEHWRVLQSAPPIPHRFRDLMEKGKEGWAHGSAIRSQPLAFCRPPPGHYVAVSRVFAAIIPSPLDAAHVTVSLDPQWRVSIASTSSPRSFLSPQSSAPESPTSVSPRLNSPTAPALYNAGPILYENVPSSALSRTISPCLASATKSTIALRTSTTATPASLYANVEIDHHVGSNSESEYANMDISARIPTEIIVPALAPTALDDEQKQITNEEKMRALSLKLTRARDAAARIATCNDGNRPVYRHVMVHLPIYPARCETCGQPAQLLCLVCFYLQDFPPSITLSPLLQQPDSGPLLHTLLRINSQISVATGGRDFTLNVTTSECKWCMRSEPVMWERDYLVWSCRTCIASRILAAPASPPRTEEEYGISWRFVAVGLYVLNTKPTLGEPGTATGELTPPPWYFYAVTCMRQLFGFALTGEGWIKMTSHFAVHEPSFPETIGWLVSQRWFYGEMSASEAEAIAGVHRCHAGSWLLRFSSSEAGALAFTVVEHTGRIRHHRVNRGPKHEYVLRVRSNNDNNNNDTSDGNEEKSYATLKALLEGACTRLNLKRAVNESGLAGGVLRQSALTSLPSIEDCRDDLLARCAASSNWPKFP